MWIDDQKEYAKKYLKEVFNCYAEPEKMFSKDTITRNNFVWFFSGIILVLFILMALRSFIFPDINLLKMLTNYHDECIQWNVTALCIEKGTFNKFNVNLGRSSNEDIVQYDKGLTNAACYYDKNYCTKRILVSE